MYSRTHVVCETCFVLILFDFFPTTLPMKRPRFCVDEIRVFNLSNGVPSERKIKEFLRVWRKKLAQLTLTGTFGNVRLNLILSDSINSGPKVGIKVGS
jgi:hypothetical protein